MEGIAELGSCQTGTLHIVAVGFVDDNAVGHLHDATLDALQFVARSRQLDEQEEIDHGVDSSLALTDTDRFHKNLVKTGRLAEDDCFTRLAGYATQ